jgi:hypothetical protein
LIKVFQISRSIVGSFLFFIFLIGILSACGETTMRTQPGARDMAPRLEATSFNQLANWQNDRHGRALRAFARSCTALMKTPDHKTIQSFDKQFLPGIGKTPAARLPVSIKTTTMRHAGFSNAGLCPIAL